MKLNLFQISIFTECLALNLPTDFYSFSGQPAENIGKFEVLNRNMKIFF